MDAFWRFWDRMGPWQKVGLCFVAAVIILTLIRMMF
jgi:hypothetical protein